MNRPIARRGVLGAVVWLSCLAAGFAIAGHGYLGWDSRDQYEYSRWLMARLVPGMVGPDHVGSWERLRWYGSLWEIYAGFFTEIIFRNLRDPYAVRSALTISLFGLTLAATFRALRTAGKSRADASLGTAIVFGLVRLGGHALHNPKDFPFACAYLWATLELWNIIPTLSRQLAERKPRVRTVVWTTVVVTVPQLLRPISFLHLGLFLVGWTFAVARARGLGGGRQIFLVVLPAVIAAALALSFSPGFHQSGLLAWVESLRMFTRFPWEGTIRLYGKTFPASAIPWWYVPSLFPLQLPPLSLAVAVWGLARILTGRERADLARYLLFFSVFPLAMMLWRRPILYDEDRHVLFLFPPFFLACALGFESVSSRKKYALTALVVGSAILAYARWGKFSYVYRSSIVGNFSGERFMGDYWGVCVDGALRRLVESSLPLREVVVLGPRSIVEVALPHVRVTEFRPEPVSPDAVILALNRQSMDVPVRRAIDGGQLRKLFSVDFPDGVPACTVAVARAGKVLPNALGHDDKIEELE